MPTRCARDRARPGSTSRRSTREAGRWRLEDIVAPAGVSSPPTRSTCPRRSTGASRPTGFAEALGGARASPSRASARRTRSRPACGSPPRLLRAVSRDFEEARTQYARLGVPWIAAQLRLAAARRAPCGVAIGVGSSRARAVPADDAAARHAVWRSASPRATSSARARERWRAGMRRR